MTAGLTPTGFVPKTVAEIIAELQQAQRSTVDGTLNTSSTGVLANVNMAFATQLAQVWELGQEIYDAHDPATAEGVALDHNGALIGVTRRPATKAQTVLALTLAANTQVPTGSVVSNPAIPTTRFVTTQDATTTTTAGVVNVTAEAETAGALEAAAHTLTKIESPVSGWTAVDNPGPAIPGFATETDEAYRARQVATRATTEGATLAGIVADVLLLPNVITAKGYENTADVPVGGMPGHSFEIVVSGGDDLVIALSIWGNKPAGIETHGTTSVTITDTEGVTHVVRFSRPTAQVVNVNYLATVSDDYVPGSIRAALEIASTSPTSPMRFEIGSPVYLVRLLSVAADVLGVVNITLDIEFAPTVPADAVPTAPNRTLTVAQRDAPTFSGATWVAVPP